MKYKILFGVLFISALLLASNIGNVKAGLDGIEVYYPNHTDNIIRFYERIAKKHKLITTGGSDAHGDIKKHTYVGKIKVPYLVVEKLKK